jgi:hypothetical protein
VWSFSSLRSDLALKRDLVTTPPFPAATWQLILMLSVSSWLARVVSRTVSMTSRSDVHHHAWFIHHWCGDNARSGDYAPICSHHDDH